ncbi:hypothetical protein PUNSTDRAFT_115360 [Punctularia strigosozonata HHB-11173 SS5]|uniref:uncharacterized protein n=1 Tax=Punctularia strigosozonata (strain HHB-11173) TaxID=741275 RepID=UPI0004417724|nr:uncharacterized protein PUNSTDRAFT_115360 [Punctularia strigosozonata HHB-11173 SS5]EIN05959.1 hypothetical protein PUNSTDRAFT_115360 [Punctularia strigosozonata HHB-11173 SS5]
MTVASPQGAGDVPETDELKSFREAWKAEVRRRRGELSTDAVPRTSTNTGSSPADKLHDAQPSASSDEAFVKAWAFQEASRPAAIDGPTSKGKQAPVPAASRHARDTSQSPTRDRNATPRTVPNFTFSPIQKRAIDVYRRAMQAEQNSELDEALRLYRQAFRLDTNVDRAFEAAELLVQSQVKSAKLPPSADGTAATSARSAQSTVVTHRHTSSGTNATSNSKITGLLARIVSGFPPDVKFEPEDEREGFHFVRLPDELIVDILTILDPTAIERFAAVSRRARILSLDSTIWRNFAKRVYRPPQIPPELTLEGLADNYDSDYRRLYVEHPRLRLDGVYIAVCHYIRPGLSENVWVNIHHLITYHRYLRFFPDGTVLSLLANEQLDPHNVIPHFKHSLRMKGLFLGTWSLDGTTVTIDGLAPLSSSTSTSLSVTTAHSGSNARDAPAIEEQCKYVFRMTFSLRSRPLGRWNKLEWVEYESVRVEDGEATPFPLKQERPFWFSKVRSYGGP